MVVLHKCQYNSCAIPCHCRYVRQSYVDCLFKGLDQSVLCVTYLTWGGASWDTFLFFFFYGDSNLY